MPPPEINSWRMCSGAGSAPMLQAAAAWQGISSESVATATSFSSMTWGLVYQLMNTFLGFLDSASGAPIPNGQTSSLASGGGTPGRMSGFFNTASGGTGQSGVTSCIGNTSIPGVLGPTVAAPVGGGSPRISLGRNDLTPSNWRWRPECPQRRHRPTAPRASI
ncbi:PPE domain-containing protein [Mycobacterium persicum]|uniref:PPE domain-containing protein n=1 Tax=Mycobacterium persicum TaxID=1487726 RepID=UPI000A0D7D46|nr:hypothetical protein BST40_05095 [Mycobacterium persicum]